MLESNLVGVRGTRCTDVHLACDVPCLHYRVDGYEAKAPHVMVQRASSAAMALSMFSRESKGQSQQLMLAQPTCVSLQMPSGFVSLSISIKFAASVLSKVPTVFLMGASGALR